jgi:glycosyltransferase involved in cell wall biosynthesis
MKKIGLFMEYAPSGGGTFQYGQTMLDAVAALPRDRFSVVVGYTSEPWLKYLKEYNLRTVFVPRGFWGRALGLAWTLLGLPMGLWRRICPFFHPMAKTLLREKCDLWIFPSQDARGFQFPVPSLVSIHDLMHRYERRFPESASGWEYLNRERTYTNICRWAKGVLVDSELGRQQVIESYGMPAERIHVLPYIAPRYMLSGQTPPDFNSRYQLPAKFIFYPARFWAHKNHLNLIKAMARAKHDISDLKLVLAGTKSKKYDSYESVMKLVQNLNLGDDVVFLGYVPDQYMPGIYRRARALVMPTYYGPTNIPPLEAFTAGCPVAISGIYGMQEQTEDAALLFNPDSVEEIADCIKKLWIDDRLCAELAEKGRSRAANWGQKQFNDRVREIIAKIIEEGG